MKGFIEVTHRNMGKIFLVNIRWIEEVFDHTIYLGFKDDQEQDFVPCEESYDEIVAKIKEAV